MADRSTLAFRLRRMTTDVMFISGMFAALLVFLPIYALGALLRPALAPLRRYHVPVSPSRSAELPIAR